MPFSNARAQALRPRTRLMPKLLTRIVSCLLVPCLLADPLAAVQAHSTAPSVHRASVSIFQSQAFNLQISFSLNKLLGRIPRSRPLASHTAYSAGLKSRNTSYLSGWSV